MILFSYHFTLENMKKEDFLKEFSLICRENNLLVMLSLNLRVTIV